MTDALAPSALRAEIVERALDRRPPGRPVDAVAPCTPAEAFRGAAEQLHALLSELTPADWTRRSHADIGTVRDVVAHVVGVERQVLEWLALPAGEQVATEHLAASRAAITDLDGVDPVDLVGVWFAAAQSVLAACTASDPTRRVNFNGLPTDVEGLLVLRAFELWSHLQDVCAATERPLPEVDEPRLTLMSSRLMAAVPNALLMRRTAVDVERVRFVLTGRAGGCYDVDLKPEVTEPAGVTIVIDTEAVCRVAARRLGADDVDVFVEGDDDAARAVLDAIDAFARD